MKICEFCKTELERGVNEEGFFLYCPNEMCLDQSEFYIEQEPETDPYPHLADMKDFDYDGWME